MKRNCNLCGKKSVLWTRHLIHGDSRFQLCRHCASRIKELHNREDYQAAKAYLESKMAGGSNERMNFIIRSKIRNAFQWTENESNDPCGEEDCTVAALIQSIGVLGGGALFLLGICMLNIHLKLALLFILSALLLGIVLYGIGAAIALVLHYFGRK